MEEGRFHMFFITLGQVSLMGFGHRRYSACRVRAPRENKLGTTTSVFFQFTKMIWGEGDRYAQ